MEINIELDSFNKIYNIGDYITGNISISNNEKTLDFDFMNLILTVIILFIQNIFFSF